MKKKITKKKNGLGCVILFISPFVLIGTVTLYLGLTNLYLQIQTNNWIPVTSKIRDVKIVATNTNSGGGGRTGSGGGTSYETKCNYTYSYKNKEYSNNIISIGYGSNNTENHIELYRILKYTSTLTAYVNPNKPSDSTLARGINSSTTSLLIFSILWNGFIILMFKTKNYKRFFIIFSLVFISGLIVIFTGISHTNFKKKIKIIKKMNEEEIEEIKNKELQEMIDKYGSEE